MPTTKAPPTNRASARQSARGRATRTLAPAGGRRLSMGSRGQGFRNFIRELRSEIRKVVWPSRREVVNLTAVIVALSAVLGAFLGGIDYIFQEFFRYLLRVTGAGGF
jgi:preprotein translocase subunit SecE